MNQGQVVSLNEVLCLLLRTCEQCLLSNREVEAKVTYDNILQLAMVYGCSDEAVRAIFAVAFMLPGSHPELAYFGRRATRDELAHLYKLQQGHFETAKVIDRASTSSKGFPPLFG